MVAIVSDTHMPKGRRELPPRCVEVMRRAEAVVHAGDWSGPEVLAFFDGLGLPVIGVHGNVEHDEVRRRLPERAELAIGDHTVAVIHDAGPASGRLRRLRRLFPGADAVIFGHSHLPLLERAEDGFQIFNPGSPTERRRAPQRSMGIVRAGPGGLAFEHLQLGG